MIGRARIGRIRRHVSLASPTIAQPFLLREVILDDAVSSWEAAGFAVDSDGKVKLGDDLVVRLVSSGTRSNHGLVGVTLSTDDFVGKDFIPGVPVVPATPSLSPQSGHVHPNSVTGLGELVFWVHTDVDTVVSRLAREFGVSTHKARPAKKIGPLKVARFFFGRVRVLMAGFAQPGAPSNAAITNWMVGTAGDQSAEITGWLPRTGDMNALHRACPAVGEVKEAAQKGRQIATLKAGAIEGLTGTFAFISDASGDGRLF